MNQLRGITLVVDTVAAKTPVISGLGATRTLNTNESGSTVIFDRAAGTVITLPPPANSVGTFYRFVTNVAVTSNNFKVITDTTTTFMQGQITTVKTSDGTSLRTFADGTTIRAVTSNGSTSGGLIGGDFMVVCVSPTEWQISGSVLASGTIVTPLATS